jgi:hypothetical protein
MNWKKLAANVAIYATGDFLVVAVRGFLLVPLYTPRLSPADDGVFVVTKAMRVPPLFFGIGTALTGGGK